MVKKTDSDRTDIYTRITDGLLKISNRCPPLDQTMERRQYQWSYQPAGAP